MVVIVVVVVVAVVVSVVVVGVVVLIQFLWSTSSVSISCRRSFDEIVKSRFGEKFSEANDASRLLEAEATKTLKLLTN